MWQMLGPMRHIFMSARGIHSLDLQCLGPYLGEGDREVVEDGVEAGVDTRWRLERGPEQDAGGRRHRS